MGVFKWPKQPSNKLLQLTITSKNLMKFHQSLSDDSDGLSMQRNQVTILHNRQFLQEILIHFYERFTEDSEGLSTQRIHQSNGRNLRFLKQLKANY